MTNPHPNPPPERGREKKRRTTLFPKEVGNCLQPVTRPAFARLGPAAGRIITDWPKIVGPQLAACTVPLKLSFPKGKTTDGTLTLAVQNGFALELQHMQPVILEKLAVYFGYKAINKIKISHTYAAGTPAKPQKPVLENLINLTTTSLDDIEDSDLRKVLESFAQTLSVKKKSL